jgi:large subunit ribosomal protein L9
MDVILLEDVPNVGKKYEEHEVADGYGTNYLLPNGLAQVANDRTRAKYEKQKEQAEAKRQQKRERKAEALANLEDVSVTISAKTGEQGQLFAGIYPEDIADAINGNEQVAVELSDEDIVRDQPLEKVGEYTVEVSVLDQTAAVGVAVVGQ